MLKGLYEHDYFVLTEEEKKKKRELDEEENTSKERMKFKKSHHLDYPKAIRHNMSIFPNNFIDFFDLRNEAKLTTQCENFINILNNNKSNERDIKHKIQDNEYVHIPASLLSRFSFGHHDAYVFKEFKFGTSYTADYLLVGDSSNGHQFVFVECENPYGRITIADGSFGETIMKGIRQINDWKNYIEMNYALITEEFKKYTDKQLPDEFYKYDSTRFYYMVIAGRREDFNDRTYRLARQKKQESNISILHYDNWYEDTVNTIGKATY